MKARLRNITVTLNEEVARWVRVEAARAETSVSRLLGRILEQKMAHQHEYERAMRRAVKRKPFLKGTGRYLSRDETHDRSRLR